jgi:hypothetical protein
MAGPTTLQGPVNIFGSLTVTGQFVLPAASITNAMVSSGSPLDPTKTWHRENNQYAQQSNTNAVADQKVLHTTYSTLGGTIDLFQAGCITIGTGVDYCTVTLIKNGSVIATVNINSNSTNNTPIIASLNTNVTAQNDIFQVQVVPTHTSGTLPQGVFANLVIDENP